MKTLIEIMDNCQLENVISLLCFKPEKIVFIGFKKMIKSRIDNIKRFLILKGIDVETDIEIVGRYDYSAIVEKLNRITDTNESCCFDLRGGTELLLAAMGEVSSKKNIPILQYDMVTEHLVVVRGDESLQPQKENISIMESVVLNGGLVMNDEPGFSFRLNEDFKNDLETMWEICSKNPRIWNRQATALGNFDYYNDDKSGYSGVDVNMERIRRSKEDAYLNGELIDDLRKNGLITRFTEHNNRVIIKYKNEQVKKCLSKAGNILELYAYMLLAEIKEEECGFYNDLDVGVIVDWDGDIGQEAETRNEIDIMMMRGLVPFFISCKNGEVKKEALYELETVADHFGGKYAKKFLLTGYVNTDEAAKEYVLNRAKDMNITIIDGVDKLNHREFKKLLKEKLS